MPYIHETRRKRFDTLIKPLLLSETIHEVPFTNMCKGDVVYIISKIVHEYVLSLGLPCFDTKSTGKSVLQDALDEYKRIVMDKHEDKKRIENGGISDLDEKSLEDVR
jgi:hypothetical protein